VALLSVAIENIPLNASANLAARQAQLPGILAQAATPQEKTKGKIAPELASNPNSLPQFTPTSLVNDAAAILNSAALQLPPVATALPGPDSATGAVEVTAGRSQGNVAASLNRHTDLTSANVLSGENGIRRLDASIAFALQLTLKTPEPLLPAVAPESATPATLPESTLPERVADPELAALALDSTEPPDVARIQTTLPMAPDSTIRFAPAVPAPSPAAMLGDLSSAGQQLAAPVPAEPDLGFSSSLSSYRSLTAEKTISDSPAAAMLGEPTESRGQGPVPETPRSRVAIAVSRNAERSEFNIPGSSRTSMADRSFQELNLGITSAGTSRGSASADLQAPTREDSPTSWFAQPGSPFNLPATPPVQTNAPDQPVPGAEPGPQTAARQEQPTADPSQPEEPATSPPAPKIASAERNPADDGRDNLSDGGHRGDAFPEIFPLATGSLAAREIPRAPAQTLEASPEIAAPDAAPEGARPAMAREISIKLEGPDASSVAVQLSERAGKIDVAVRTTDSQLNKSLQSGLGDLVTQLEGHGFKTDAWTPGAARVAALMPGSSEPSANQQQSGHPGSWGSKQERQGQGDSNPRRQTRISAAFEQTLAEEDTKDGVNP